MVDYYSSADGEPLSKSLSHNRMQSLKIIHIKFHEKSSIYYLVVKCVQTAVTCEEARLG